MLIFKHLSLEHKAAEESRARQGDVGSCDRSGKCSSRPNSLQTRALETPRAGEVPDEQLQASFLRGQAKRGQEGDTAQAGEGRSAGSSLGGTPTKASVYHCSQKPQE